MVNTRCSVYDAESPDGAHVSPGNLTRVNALLARAFAHTSEAASQSAAAGLVQLERIDTLLKTDALPP